MDKLEKKLSELRNAEFPVDYAVQYDAIIERLGKKKSIMIWRQAFAGATGLLLLGMVWSGYYMHSSNELRTHPFDVNQYMYELVSFNDTSAVASDEVLDYIINGT